MSRIQVLLFSVVLVVLFPYQLHGVHGARTDPTEVNALEIIRGSLIDPLGNLATWNRGDPCTVNWTGVFCYTIPNDDYLHVRELQLFDMNLSGTLAPEIALLSYLKILDFMWNNLTGSIPKEIGNITSLRLILLNGNNLSGPLPDEIGFLHNLNRLQIDLNQISGLIPKSFANLSSVKHLHMNNNSLSGQIPSELSQLPILFHFLVDNNNLSGYLPPEFSQMPSLKILQADNNNFSGSSIPVSYHNISTLVKLSLRNCKLEGVVPDLSSIPQLGYLDLSWNQLTGPIPTNRLASNITTVDLSHNLLNGTIPLNFSSLPNLQRLSLSNNHLDGAVPSIWSDITLTGNKSLQLDFQNNSFTTLPAPFAPPTNVTVLLYGNPVCANANKDQIANICQPGFVSQAPGQQTNSTTKCVSCPVDEGYEYNPSSPIPCLCALPLGVGMRLKSPGFSDFDPYMDDFEINLTSLLNISLYQVYIERYQWEPGPRLNMHLKLFPNNTSLFSKSEIVHLRGVLAGWEITLSDLFGPYELLNFTLGHYADEFADVSKTGLSKIALAGILVGSIIGAIALSAVASLLILRRRLRYQAASKRGSLSRLSIKIEGVKCFTFEEMTVATDHFNDSTQVGQGGYGKVYKGVLTDGTTVAIKRAHEESLQGSKEFCTEIELLSRLHHRNLVALVGYCDEQDEQMLVYEFMPNGTLRDHLSAKSTEPMNFTMRLHVALGAAKGILYLHTEANPPIFHRDIKASNILLDTKYVAKVADFGLSRLAPVPDVEGSLPAHVSTVVKGTPGYLDPEYFLTHKLTDKSDVYSLGVVFLELLTGMKPIAHGKNIVREVNVAYQSGLVTGIIDNRIGSCPIECIEKFLALALKCCQDEPDARPSVTEIVRELESIWRMMPEADISLSKSLEKDSSKMTKSTSASSATGTLFISSQNSDSENVNSGIPTRTLAPR